MGLSLADTNGKESRLFYDFRVISGSLLSENQDAWQTAFWMQHHSLPTRFLDWTGSFGIALYFALKNAKRDAVVWILDPNALNKRTYKKKGDEEDDGYRLYCPDDLPDDYQEIFLDQTKEFSATAIALAPGRHHPRLFHQSAYFTLHRDLEQGLEKTCPEALRKIEIPVRLFSEAKNFLKLAGINEFSVFPDLDGLSRHLHEIHFTVSKA